jgi:hypothetical protein
LLPLQGVGVAQRQEEVGAGACDVETVLDGGGGGLYVFDGMGQEVVTVERVELELYTVEMGAGVEEEEETGGASHGSVDSRSLET